MFIYIIIYILMYIYIVDGFIWVYKPTCNWGPHLVKGCKQLAEV